MMEHISRSWGPDRLAAECGCPLLPCGFVDAKVGNDRDCPQHSFMAGKTIRSSHDEAQCPAREFGHDD